MSASDMGLGVVDAAVEAPVIGSAAVDQTVDTTAADSTVDTTPETGVEETATETETHNADGTEKTPEEQEAFKTAAAAKSATKEVLPTEARAGLKALRDLDPKYANVVKQLHGHYERYEAVKPMLGSEGILGLKSFLADTGVKDISELRQAYTQTQEQVEAVRATDELLYAADPTLWKNVVEGLKATGHPEALGKLAGSFIQTLKEHDLDAFYSEVSKPTMLEGLQEAGFVDALNKAFSQIDSDPKAAKAALAAIGKWFTDLRNEQSDTAKISKERAAWEKERSVKETEEQKAERSKVENGIAEECDKYNNKALGRELGAYLKLPFFKSFQRETLIDLGNGIKEHLYSALKADKAYQTQMSAMWKQKTPDRAKMTQYHNAKLDSIAGNIVREVVQRRYPGYAKGGSAVGKAAEQTAKAAANSKASATSIASMKPVYVAARPTNLVRGDVRIGGRDYTASDLITLQIAGRGFVKTPDGKGFRYISWRKQ